MNINSSSTFNVSQSGNKGISGLASGLDTESWVEQMLTGTQKKIDTQLGLKWQDEQRQVMYRDIISSINSLHSKYFDTKYDSQLTTNLASKNFFDSMISKVTGGSEYLNIISSSSSAAVGDMNIEVNRLAKAAVMTSDHKMSASNSSVVSSSVGLADFQKKITLSLGGASAEIDLSGAATQDDIINTINQKMQAEGMDVKAEIYDGRLRLISNDTTNKVQVAGSSLGLAMTGLSTGGATLIKEDLNGNPISVQNGINKINMNAGVTFNVSYDGVEKEITLGPVASGGSGLTIDDVANEFAKKIATAFGGTASGGSVSGGYIDFSSTITRDGTDPAQDTVSFTLSPKRAGTDVNHNVTVTGINASKVGIRPGSSTQFNTGKSLGSLGNVQGQQYQFTINGKEFTFGAGDTVGSMMNTINTSGIGVRISYSSISDTFKLESTATGGNYSMSISQQEGNLLGALFGDDAFQAASQAAGKVLSSGPVQGTTGKTFADMVGGNKAYASLSLKIDGVTQTFVTTLPQGKTELTPDEIKDQFNSWLSNFNLAYDDQNNTIDYLDKDAPDAAKPHPVVEFTKTSIDLTDADAVKNGMKYDLALMLGFNTSNKSNAATSAAGLSGGVLETLNAANLTLDQTTGSLSYNGSVVGSFQNGRLVLTSNVDMSAEPEAVRNAMTALFGSDSVTVGDGSRLSTAQYTDGQDAQVIINGTVVTRSTNQFTVDGITIGLKKEAPAGTVSTISTERDAEKIVTGFQDFVKDYNDMVTKLKDYLNADATYIKYAPLTDKQREDMSESQITKWEEKAKEGLIRRDRDTETFLSQMRTALYTKPSSSNLALYDIGIETADKDGTLKINETALRNALATDPDSVKALFTDSVDGLASKLMKTMDAAAKTSNASPGTLVQKAGAKGYLESNNSIYWNIEKIKDKIDSLNAQYQKERQRYWNQFNSMESILSNFNTQSGYLTSMFGA